jgi:hypothetical protein
MADAMTDADGPDAPRYVITGGGTPTPEQLAAVTVALTPVAVVVDDEVAGPDDGLAPWARAGLLESVGHRRFVAMPDLAAGRFPLR